MKVPKQHYVVYKGRLVDNPDSIPEEEVTDEYKIVPMEPIRTVMRFQGFNHEGNNPKILVKDIKTDILYKMPHSQHNLFVLESMRGLVDSLFVVRKIGLYYVLTFYEETGKQLEIKHRTRQKELERIRTLVKKLDTLVDEDIV